MSRGQGEEALLASVTPGYATSPTALLTAIRERPNVEEGDQWNDAPEGVDPMTGEVLGT